MAENNLNKEPTEKELKKYYNKNIEDYSMINTISFATIYFSNPKDKRVDETYKLLNIADVNASEAKFFGEKSPIADSVKNYTFERVKQDYGTYFANKLFKLKKGMWYKAIHSKNGVRLVYITDKNVSKAYSFDDVQGRVYSDYLQERRKKVHDKAYKNIVSKYELKSI